MRNKKRQFGALENICGKGQLQRCYHKSKPEKEKISFAQKNKTLNIMAFPGAIPEIQDIIGHLCKGFLGQGHNVSAFGPDIHVDDRTYLEFDFILAANRYHEKPDYHALKGACTVQYWTVMPSEADIEWIKATLKYDIICCANTDIEAVLRDAGIKVLCLPFDPAITSIRKGSIGWCANEMYYAFRQHWEKTYKTQWGHDFFANEEDLKAMKEDIMNSPAVIPVGTVTEDHSAIVTTNEIAMSEIGKLKIDNLTAANMFLPPADFKADGHSLDLMGQTKEWLAQFAQNKEYVQKACSWDNLADFTPRQSDVVIIASTGPSYKKNCHLLEKVKNHTVIGVNNAAGFVHGTVFPYYVIIDRSAWPSWWTGKDFTKTRLYTTPFVNTEVFKQNWEKVFVALSSERSVYAEEVNRQIPNLPRMYSGMSVTYSALNLAAMMDPKVVVFIGQDGAFTDREVHANEPIKDWQERNPIFNDSQLIEAVDIFNGRKTVTNKMYLDIARHLTGATYFFLERGIRVINATEGGIFGGQFTHPISKQTVGIELKTLQEVFNEYGY